MKISANLSMLFTELPLVQRVLAARIAGFDGVEIQFPYELAAIGLKEALEQADLPLVLINLPAGDLMHGGPGLAAVPARQAAFDAALQEALTYAAMTRPLQVNVLAGRLAEGVELHVALATLAANLRTAAQAFAALGIGVVCEAINPLDMPGYLINTPAQLNALLDMVDHPNCKAQLDIYHLARQGLDIAGGVSCLKGRIGHVQFADCPGRGRPGSGALEFTQLLEVFQSEGYAGWYGAEFKCGADTRLDLAWLAQWRTL